MTRLVVTAALLAGCVSPDYKPTELEWKTHALSAAGAHTLVLTETDGTINAGTVESDGLDIPLPNDPNTNEPIELVLPTATALAVGARHACIVSTQLVSCWGEDEHGSLGAHRAGADGTVMEPDMMPTLSQIRAIAAADDFTCATTMDDTVMCWGANAAGQLGGSSVSALDPPVPVRLPDAKPLYVERVVTVDATACAIDRGKIAWCWGEGYGPAPVRLPYTGVTDISVGSDHGCVIASDGLTCWGNNINGQIDATAARACKSECSLPATHVPLDAQRVVVGARHTCVLDGAGDVTCMGSNENGQLARKDAFLVGDPAVAFTGAVDLVSGSTHVCALTADHAAWCWGDRK